MGEDLQIDNIVRQLKAVHLYLKMTTNWDNDKQFRIDHDPSNIVKIDSDDPSEEDNCFTKGNPQSSTNETEL